MAALLKQRTEASHRRVEARADLLDPALGIEQLGAVLVAFDGFWAGTEPLLEAWDAAGSDTAHRLGWPRRRRSPLLRADLAALGASPDRPAPPVFAHPVTDAEALGWLYVSEGSTLGGAVVHRRLAPMLDRLGVRLTSFTPYPEGPGPQWRAYLDVLEQWGTRSGEHRDAVVTAATATFAALETWLARGAEAAA